MLLDVVIQFRDRRSTITIDTPSTCPHCGRTMSPQHVGESKSSDNESYSYQGHFSVIFRCSFDDCLKYFAVEYIHDQIGKGSAVAYFYRPPIRVNLPENVDKVSPAFVEIYSQATIAEQEKLDQIAGVGYRKAAEFLIKDYTISKNPDDSDNIKQIMLGKVISDYLSDFPKLQALSRSVAWIGNDETHYVRRHNNKDLQDLKRFILAAAQFVAADYDADDALSFTSTD
ncbi:TPA: DUF4145 domain-containing protein [Streptococcus equi subsp. zooepidemicus]|uniref:Phage protein n=1 Tax=Streptococcus equi subsp. zooepidemicus TaxID=40041 RepID=A0AAX2LJI1_STRSZ|nr:DUF4145 domain-containing protein [Streptococcus equi]KIS13262.1 phage protein [Streptococcus equi subsp. zooepidemicus Sz105]QBX15591.1 hypothetical protein Javan197_0005 [Streptococcus phage Javan197]QBX24487.1 hypothetical protein Javan190_0005 [Streptococcus phage Javan190]QBX24541.1 hypothetical protein Javan192_0005 [Streptococcus phage Javan192]ASB97397.1 hypothetical protein SE071780_01810 [Streptococcus equi subsp. equi]